MTTARRREHFNTFLRSLDVEHEGLPAWFAERLQRAVARYGVDELRRGPQLEDALLRIFVAQQRQDEQLPVVLALLDGLAAKAADGDPRLRETLDRLIEATQRRFPAVAACARAVRHRRFDRPLVERARADTSAVMRRLARRSPARRPHAADRRAVDQLVACPLPLLPILADGELLATTDEPGALLEVLTRRYYKIRDLDEVTVGDDGVLRTSYERNDRTVHVFAVRAGNGGLAALTGGARQGGGVGRGAGHRRHRRVHAARGAGRRGCRRAGGTDRRRAAPRRTCRGASAGSLSSPRRATAAVRCSRSGVPATRARPYWMSGDGASADSATFEEDVKFRGLHPMIARRMQMWRLENFEIRRLPSADDVYLFDCVGRDNPSDERLVAVAEVRDLTPVRDEDGRAVALPRSRGAGRPASTPSGTLEPAGRRCSASSGTASRCSSGRRSTSPSTRSRRSPAGSSPLTDGLGLEQIVVSARLVLPGETEPVETVMRLGYEAGPRADGAPHAAADGADAAARRVHPQAHADAPAGLVYPYDLVPMLQRAGGEFVEHDLDDDGRLVAVDRPPGSNRAGVVIGVVRTPTDLYPEGMTRVAILGDATKAMGSITEAECLRILAAIDLAAEMDAPIEWLALSAGAGSPWTPAARTSTGWRGSCAGSSSTRSGVVRSTSSSPASTSAPSRTGTPRRRC